MPAELIAGKTFNAGYQNHTVAELGEMVRADREPRDAASSAPSRWRPRRATTRARTTCRRRRSSGSSAGRPSAPSRTRCVDLCARLPGRAHPGSAERHPLLQRQDDPGLGAGLSDAARRRHRRGGVHRQPHGRSARRPRLLGRGDRQPRDRPRREPRPAPARAARRLPRDRHVRRCRRTRGCSRTSTTSSTSAASATSCRRSSDPSSTCGPTWTAPSRSWRPRGTRGCGSSSTPRRRPATAWPPSCPTTEAAPIRPEYPYALSKYLGESAALHWAQVYRLPVISIRMFNVYGPRVRTTGAYGAVFGVFLAQKLHGKPFTVVGDGTQRRDFVFVTDVARAYLMAAESDADRRGLQPGRRQSPDDQPPGRADGGRRGARAQAAGRAGLHVGRHRKIQRRARLGAGGARSRRGSPRCSGTSRTGARRRCGRPRRSRRPPATWFEHLAR